MVMSMLLGWFWPISLFSVRDINLTLGLLPPRRHVVWRDSVGVESSGSGLACARLSNSIVRTYFKTSKAKIRRSHFFLLNDFSPLSQSLEQARSGLKIRVRGYFASELSLLVASH